ncbi:hypothetical protein [Dietzia sp. UBA5065]|uniref:hypothetical protein n=1 Tax=Dietzia sp. UBA5065 TaxID=1946422 RepID=UPI0025C090C9|nr:hypothetical protein [Dietzia sp. UBA5065]HMT49591.1 hypothetical protein [Dietzia sp.]
MLSDLLHDAHEAIDGSVSDLTLPESSVGDVLNGVLRLPARLISLLEYLLEDFGS